MLIADVNIDRPTVVHNAFGVQPSINPLQEYINIFPPVILLYSSGIFHNGIDRPTRLQEVHSKVKCITTLVPVKYGVGRLTRLGVARGWHNPSVEE